MKLWHIRVCIATTYCRSLVNNKYSHRRIAKHENSCDEMKVSKKASLGLKHHLLQRAIAICLHVVSLCVCNGRFGVSTRFNLGTPECCKRQQNSSQEYENVYGGHMLHFLDPVALLVKPSLSRKISLKKSTLFTACTY